MERFHKTLRAEFLADKIFPSIEEAQVQLYAWVGHYNHDRPHQSIGMVAPFERFALAEAGPTQPEPASTDQVSAEPEVVVPSATRRVGASGLVSFAGARYKAGVWLSGQEVAVVCQAGLVHLHHRGVLIATHARRHRIDKQSAGLRRG